MLVIFMNMVSRNQAQAKEHNCKELQVHAMRAVFHIFFKLFFSYSYVEKGVEVDQ